MILTYNLVSETHMFDTDSNVNHVNISGLIRYLFNIICNVFDTISTALLDHHYRDKLEETHLQNSQNISGSEYRHLMQSKQLTIQILNTV